jgi:hypothetical protein
MPTNRPRHMITESDQLSEALASAAELWPEAKGDRGRLLRHVLEAGIETVTKGHNDRRSLRRAAIAHAAGSMTEVWPEDWRRDAMGEWPA